MWHRELNYPVNYRVSSGLQSYRGVDSARSKAKHIMWFIQTRPLNGRSLLWRYASLHSVSFS
jgi:hypothetical protein